MKKILAAFILLTLVSTAKADVVLPKIFDHNMVLQRDKQIVVWGWASPKEKVTVQFNKQTKTVTADKNGSWKLNLDPESAGGPFELKAKGKNNTITLRNILVGEVWICSGQSNMAWTVSISGDPENEIKQANYPTIRHFYVPNEVAGTPRMDVAESKWEVCSPETVGDFTAVGYYFARELTKELNVPVGLINSTWGGTNVETWTSREGFQSSDEFKSMIAGMPKLNLDSLGKLRYQQQLKKVESIQGKLDDPSTVKQFTEQSFDDSSWKQMLAPEIWEHQDLPDFDGVVWFRKTIALSANQAGKAASLELGMIDDSDETYVNGTKVGEMKSKWDAKRNYTIPAGLLKEGKNIIAVRIEDYGYGGGMHGQKEEFKLTIGGDEIPLHGKWSYRVESMMAATTIGPNNYPTLLFNAMINPIIPFTMRGVIWYQGEANVWRANQYKKSFPLMIADWRAHWGLGDFPFYFVQLSSYNEANGTSEKGSTWAELREAQTSTLSVPNTGMAVTTDIGDALDIHPKNKQEVGRRLAAVALSKTYGKNNLASGPTYKSFTVKGNKIVVRFDNVGSGLMVNDKYGYLKGFEIAGKDQKFKYAKAYLEGNEVVVYHDDIQEPVAVRFGWADVASDDNLYNKEGFPAGPFRTDTWKGMTDQEKYKF